MESISVEYMAGFLAIAGFIAFLIFLSGKRVGGAWEKENRISAEKKFQRELMLLESRKNELQKEIEDLMLKNEKYLYFLVRLPEAVKHLNSNLSFDEIISSILRLTRDLVDTDAV